MDWLSVIAAAVLVADWIIRIGLSLRVIMRKRSVGASLAWLALIMLVPLFGAVFYLIVGETRLGGARAENSARIREGNREPLERMTDGAPVEWSKLTEACHALHRQGCATTGFGALAGNDLDILDDTQEALRAIIKDIDEAKSSVHMLFYIWSRGGTADDVADALVRAAERGVACRILVDAVGSDAFLESAAASRLRDAGVQVVAALPVGVVRALFRRIDVRNHRKIVVIDGDIGYTGSLNLADARFFKKDEGVGEWVDAMVRVRGPAVEALSMIFLMDWELETGRTVEDMRDEADVHHVAEQGGAVAQVVPSGPGATPRVIHEMLLSTIYAARERLILTTPYFVPDDAMITALITAAHRGVHVTVVIPEKIDSPLVRLACNSHLDTLLDNGVRVMLYREGLLHAKTITVDDELAVIGSVNLDMRSFWLNFEVTLFVYDNAFNDELRYVQHNYITESRELTQDAYAKRPAWRRLIENTARLLGPVL